MLVSTDQLSPPSVDLYIPEPTWFEPKASPVPKYSTLLLLGSCAMQETFTVLNANVSTCFQKGLLAVISFVFQSPPVMPAASTFVDDKKRIALVLPPILFGPRSFHSISAKAGLVFPLSRLCSL